MKKKDIKQIREGIVKLAIEGGNDADELKGIYLFARIMKFLTLLEELGEE